MLRCCRGLVLLLLLVATSALAASRSIDDFEMGLAPAWTVKEFRGRTDYRVVAEGGGGRVLRAESRGTASGLVYPIDYRLSDYPQLTWRWKIDHVIAGGDETHKAGDDYAARVYVVFPHWFFPLTKSINYIWANRLPQGASLPNAFTGNAIMLAVESGNARAGEWVTERRDVAADYRRLFGSEPPAVGAIAIMTDTDQTGEVGLAWYDDLRIEE